MMIEKIGAEHCTIKDTFVRDMLQTNNNISEYEPL
jgi:hypothetical protein